ncbi:type II toxin-antitoxin system YafQ family toxin [Streptococcus mutans]|uniref:type II toxin-antitoxin system YafQ family toxin n=1 Tax=Streptococcus mutans TaxID=1309 RepID=UPI0002B51A1A|nr:type II toxin-antitoxin system YafQ family toxin [Streptococcus mutans]EMB76048.1 toxin-antitoxin system, toxin component, RelE family protein [Streptococcus mutans 2VS1]
MYQVKFTSAFKKSYKRIQKLRLGQTLEEKYRDHELKGNFVGFRECHIKPDWLLIYLIEDDILTLTLADTGSHADLFKM